MRAHYFQHVPFEGLGYIEKWLSGAGYNITGTRFYEKSELPDFESVDFLVIMGGPMSVNDEKIFPWLREEKQFIRKYISTQKPAIGICLGAQLLADVLGAKIYPNKQKEIGWFPINPNGSIKTRFQFSPETTVFHWHGETFDLPPEAILLAESDGCKHQAFEFRESIYGFQFHLEVTPDTVEKMILNCGHELTQGRYIQTADEIRKLTDQYYGNANKLLEKILARITRRN